MDGFQALSSDDLTNTNGVSKLNTMLQKLFNQAAGDGISISDFTGYGSPEGVIAAGVGATYRRIDSASGTSYYIKSSGSGNTGWTAVNIVTYPLSVANGGTGADFSSTAANKYLYFSSTGVLSTIDVNIHGIQIFTSSGTFIAPTGITQVYLSGTGAGGGGGASVTTADAGGGGGAGEYVIMQPYNVTPGNSYTVTLNNGGTGGNNSGSGSSDGGTTVFDTLTLVGGKHGLDSSHAGAVNGGAGGLTSGATINASASVSTFSATGASGINRQQGGNGAKGDATGQGTGGGGGATPFGSGGTGILDGNGSAGATNSGSGGAGRSGGNAGTTGAGAKGIMVVIY